MADLDSVYEQRLLASPRRAGGAAVHTPGSGSRVSPVKSWSGTPTSRDVISDRFIPSRGGTNLQASYALLPDDQGRQQQSQSRGGEGNSGARDEAFLETYNILLKNELLGNDTLMHDRTFDRSLPQSPLQRNLFRFKSTRPQRDENFSWSRSPVGVGSQRLLTSPRKAPRKISTVPYKVLDAPALQDDFYLNLVDWSALNVLAVGLGTCVYLWSACTSKVTAAVRNRATAGRERGVPYPRPAAPGDKTL